jgi:hypothetical protein
MFLIIGWKVGFSVGAVVVQKVGTSSKVLVGFGRAPKWILGAIYNENSGDSRKRFMKLGVSGFRKL